MIDDLSETLDERNSETIETSKTATFRHGDLLWLSRIGLAGIVLYLINVFLPAHFLISRLALVGFDYIGPNASVVVRYVFIGSLNVIYTMGIVAFILLIRRNKIIQVCAVAALSLSFAAASSFIFPANEVGDLVSGKGFPDVFLVSSAWWGGTSFSAVPLLKDAVFYFGFITSAWILFSFCRRNESVYRGPLAWIDKITLLAAAILICVGYAVTLIFVFWKKFPVG